MPSIQSPGPNDIDFPREQIEPLLRTTRMAGLLQELSDADFEIIIGFCRFRSVQPGTRVIQEGTDADCLLLVVDGRLDVRRSDGRGGELNIGTVGIGSVLGEAAITTHTARFASVDAATRAVLGSLYHADFQRMTSIHPATALRLILVLFNQVSARMRNVAEQLVAASKVRTAAQLSMEMLSNVLLDRPNQILSAPRHSALQSADHARPS